MGSKGTGGRQWPGVQLLKGAWRGVAPPLPKAGWRVCWTSPHVCSACGKTAQCEEQDVGQAEGEGEVSVRLG